MPDRKLHTSEEGRADMRKNATELIQEEGTSIASMMVAGMMLSLLDDIDTLLDEINEIQGTT